ncbi:hypothetical protein T4B_9898 [Trichinella pseudospiralis]|uniref:Uncharacterized protein n=1 Tax=Trichinella pseudospiralis TaxID=6337 RepID=A0A0V1GCQ4_TRIPS|nr:hypothetical protein T4B_9898 [Trichinella pseudospiralis]
MAKNFFLQFGLWNKWHPKFLLPMLIHCEDISVLKISRDVCN